MKITIIGSSQYAARIFAHQGSLQAQDHEVRIPAFDSIPELDDIGVCDYNLEQIEWADEVHVLWDQRSTGTVFDLGMVFALKKPLKIIYLAEKTFPGVMRKYERRTQEG